jgi:hypothetical protein
MKKWLTNTMIALSVGVVLLLPTAPARASYFYQIFDDGIAQTAILTPVGSSFASVHSTTNFDITIASSLTVQSSGLTTLDTQLQAHEKVGVTGQHTIEIKIAFTDYALPAGTPLFVTSSGSANFGDAAPGDKGTGQAWANAANTSAFNTGTTDVKQTATSSGGSAFGVTLLPNPDSFLFTRSGNFALNQDLTVALTNNINTTGQVELLTTVAPVPAPAGLVLALTGMPVLAFGGWMRRRWLKKA